MRLEAPVAAALFEQDQPLPWSCVEHVSAERDDVAAAESLVARAEREADRDAQAAALLRLSDAWLAAGALAPALTAARRALAIHPEHPAALERAATLLARAGAHLDAAALHERRAALGEASAWRLAAECCARAGAWTRAIECASRLVHAQHDEESSLFAVEVARAAGDPPTLIALLEAHRARARDPREGLATLVDVWVETRASRCGAEVAAPLLATAPALARSILRESLARAVQAEQWPSAVEASRALEAIAEDADERAAVVLAHALLTRDATDRERARDALADLGDEERLLAELWADASAEQDAELAAASWRGLAAMLERRSPDRSIEAWGRALGRVPDDEDALAAVERLIDEHPASALDAIAAACLENSERPLARARLALRWSELEARFGDHCAAELARERASALGVAVLAAPEDESTRARLRVRAAVDDFERAQGDSAAADVLIRAVAETPGAVEDFDRVSRALSALAPRREDAARAWLRLIRRDRDPESRAVALRRIATRGPTSALRARAATMLAGLPAPNEEDASAAVELLELVLDESREDAPWVAATIAAIAARAKDGRFFRSALRSAHATWNGGPHSPGAKLLGRLLGVERGDDPVADLFDDQSRLRARVAAWSALASAHAGFADSRSALARWTRTLLASASDPSTTLEVTARFAARAPLSAEAAFAYFGAASMGSALELITEATLGVLRALSSAKDAAALSRSAIMRLSAALGERAALSVAVEAAQRMGLADKGLRAATLALADRSTIDDATARDLIEAALLAASVDERADAAAHDEEAALLRKLVERSRADGPSTVARALRRLIAVTPSDPSALTAWVRALVERGDGAGLLVALPSLLEAELDPAARRDALWTLAGVQRALGQRDAAIQTLERLGAEVPDPRDRAQVVRALEALDARGRANDLLVLWGTTTDDTATSAAFLCRAAICARLSGAPARRVFALARDALIREPETPEALVLAEEVAREAQLVAEMVELYKLLDELAAGAHGRAALAYRRALFLEQTGHEDQALEAYFAAFEARPARGAVASAIARLAVGRRPDLLVALHRRLADGAATGSSKVAHLLDAARAAKLEAHDKVGALRLLLEAQDVLRDASTTVLVMDTARALREEDPAAHRAAAELIADRGLAVAEEVWDDDARRAHALRAFECAVVDLDDPARARRAAEMYLRDSDDEGRHVEALRSVLRAAKASERVRAELRKVAVIARRSSSATQTAMTDARKALETARSMAAQGDAPAALAAARSALARGDDAELRAYAEALARAIGDASAELELIDNRLGERFDPAQHEDDLLRIVELLRGPLAKSDEAWRRLSRALNAGLRSDAALRVAHELAEQRLDWAAVAAVLELRIARAEDRAEARALRLRRAAVLEQRLSDVAGARAELEAVIDDEPSHRPALRYLADLHLRAERFAAAGECYARAAAVTHGRAESAELLAMAGEAFEAGGETASAHAQFRRALELDASSARALAGLERALRAKGELDALERTLVTLSNSTPHEADRAVLRVAAARAALDAGAIFRAKSHVDAARAHAAPSELAALDARLEQARENDRPISRSRMAAVVAAEAQDRRAPSIPPRASSAPPTPIEQSPLLEEPLLIEPLPPGSALAAPAGLPRARSAPPSAPAPHDAEGAIDYTAFDEGVLRARFGEGDDDAGRALVARLVRTEGGREEALRIERERFARAPTKLEVLQSIEGLLSMLDRPEHALAVRTVRETLSGVEPKGVAPPLNRTPEPPPDSVARWMLPQEGVEYAEIGALLWDSLGTLFRREITGYGVTGVDRVMSAAPTDVARMYTAIARLLQMPRTAVFVRAQVPGGVQVARTQPPSVILASALTYDAPVPRFMLGSAMEATRPAWVLTSLDAAERSVLVRALLATFGPKGRLQGEPPEVTRRARDLVATIPPRSQKRLEELLATLAARGHPFTEASWVEFAERARARAGLFASGDFAVAAQLVVVRHKGGGEADVPGSIGALPALDDLARFAISDPYLRLRWEVLGARRR